MKVDILEEFSLKLNAQVKYIAKDKPLAARKFKSHVIQAVKNLRSIPPYQNRKSTYYEDENIRDLIFKGYTITYRILPEEELIEVFGFINYQEKP